jgi:hypothetical protein
MKSYEEKYQIFKTASVYRIFWRWRIYARSPRLYFSYSDLHYSQLPHSDAVGTDHDENQRLRLRFMRQKAAVYRELSSCMVLGQRFSWTLNLRRKDENPSSSMTRQTSSLPSSMAAFDGKLPLIISFLSVCLILA